jgi:hypothetical protein
MVAIPVIIEIKIKMTALLLLLRSLMWRYYFAVFHASYK